MPRMAPDVFEEFLEQPHVGVIATLRKDGMPYTVPVWWLWKKTADAPAGDPKAYPPGEIWITGTYSRVWCKQLLADGRSSLCIEATAPVSGHIEFDGLCEAFERPNFDIWPISRELAEKYVGRRDPANAAAVDAFFSNMQTEPRLLFRLTPQVVRAIDMRVYRGKRADREFQAGQSSAMATDRSTAVVFDLGGVLIDWNPRYLYRQLFHDEAAMEHFLRHVCTPAWNLEQDRGRSIAEGVRLLQCDHPQHAELIAAYYERWDEMVPGAIEVNVTLLADLADAGVPVFALTNFSAETYPRAAARFPFFERFAGVVVSGDVGLLKPDGAIYRLLLERHRLQASRTVFIDDVERNVVAAQALGMDGICYQAGVDLRRELVARGLLP